MFLKEITFQNLARLADVTVALPFDGQKPLPLLVTGPSGVGKTSFLEAIIAAKEAAGCYRAPPVRADWATGAPSARAVMKWSLSDAEVSLTGTGRNVETTWDLGDAFPAPTEPPELLLLFAEYSRSPLHWKVEYFHAGRGAEARFSAPLMPEAVLRQNRLTREANKYAWVRSFLEGAQAEEGAALTAKMRETGLVVAGAEPPVLGGFARNVALLSPRLRWLGAKRRGEGWDCLFARKGGETVELSHLSGSESAAVLVAATVEALGLASSLILIDLPEQGLHPEDHLTFFNGLASLGNAQIIAATTSPALLRSAPREHVLVLRDR